MTDKLLKHIFNFFLAGFLSLSVIRPVNAWTINFTEETCGSAYQGRSKGEKAFEPLDTQKTQQKVNEVNAATTKLKNFCEKLAKHLEQREDNGEKVDTNVFPTQSFDWGWKQETVDEYNQRFDKIIAQNPSFKNEYDSLKAEYEKLNTELEFARAEELAEHKRAVAAGEYQPCGSEYPRGCPEGMECYSSYSVSVQGTGGSYSSSTLSYTCKKSEDVKKPLFGEKQKPVEKGTDTSTVVTTTAGFSSYTVKTDETGKNTTEEDGITVKRGDNSACSIPDMQKMYQSTCYSCKIIMTLITTFMNACGKVYDLTREAGSKVLVIGSMLWLAAFALKLVSAFTNQEPMSILNTLLIFMFKVAAAYIVINVGIGAIVDLFVNPLLLAGADYGLGLLQAANQGIIKVALTSNFTYNGTEIISPVVINKIMALTEGIDKTVSTNLVIGHALTCHSFNAGMLEYTGGLFGVNVTIRIPDLWIWLCGAAIWFCGFMLTLGIGYYLLDVCFKIGFCIMALPIVIGLWPFGPTSGKFTSCMSIIFRSAALFTFLALTTSYALSLISVSLGDLTTFYAKIKAGDAEWVSNTFSISGANFILIMFAYVYSIKMIGATGTGYVGKFFNDSTFGDASPMHMKATQMTAFVKNKVTQAASFAGGVVTHQATRAAGAVAGGAVNFVKNRVNGGKDANKDNKDADKKDNEGKKEGDSPKDNNKPN